MVYKRISPCSIDFEIDYGSPTRRHRYGLDTSQRRRTETPAFIDAVKYLSDHMKGRGEVRAADTEINAHRFAGRDLTDGSWSTHQPSR